MSPTAWDTPAARTTPPHPPTATEWHPFLDILARQLRAHDRFGVWEKKSDTELLAPFVVSRQERRQIPLIADPDSRLLWHLEQFYNAVAIAVERVTGVMAAPILKLSHEGYGRIVLIAGRLVVLSQQLRDVHRFGFDSLDHLTLEAEKLVSEAVTMIRRYPEIADL
jgi:probable nitrogen fixation protein